MNTPMTFNQYKAYMKFVVRWNDCTHFGGVIVSRVDRTNDVYNYFYFMKLGVADLIPYLLIDEKTNAFIYRANLGRKNVIQVVEIYRDIRPRATEWRECHAQFALRLDVDLTDGLDDGVAVPDFVVPFLQTAQSEAIINNP